jgi:hypothetical protein
MSLSGVVAIVLLVLVIVAARRVFTRKGRGAFGAGAAGAYYDMLNKDQREAVHTVVEKRAERQDPEDREGNLPELSRDDVSRE